MRKVLLGAVGLAVLLTPVTPAQASRTALIDAEIQSVRLMNSGSVRVEFRYRCDERYGPPEELSLHIEPYSHSAWIDDGADCDGTVQTVVGNLQPLESKQIGQRFVVYLNVSVADSPSNPYPGLLWAGGSNTYSVESDGSLSRLADLKVQRTRLNDRGRLVVGMSYECPPGYYVDVEDDSDWADVVVYQETGEWERWMPLGDDIVCDGTRHTVVRRFRTTATRWLKDSMDPTLPVVVNTKIIVRGPTGGASAWDAQAFWPH
jgi:hypothetical protein